jgi:hypothetical protein
MALVQTNTCLIHDYKCAEQQPQHDAPASPAAAAQVPQAPTPLLIPPLNQLALLLAARAPGENAENAQDEVAQGPRMPEQRKITAAIMKEWGPHKALRALGAPLHRGSVALAPVHTDYPLHLKDGNRSARALPPTRLYARRRRARLRSVQAKSAQLDPTRVAQFT